MKAIIPILLSILGGACALGADDGQPAAGVVDHWKDQRFGMFIHWGPVALTGHEIGWSRGQQTPIEEYDRLYQRFNPTEFDADEWVAVAKAAGMKYLVLTTKHHDGFCLWDSEFTGYDIAATPFKRDVVAELAAACRREGLAFGAYYSTCDWWHPAFPNGSPGGRTRKETADLGAYAGYLENQVTELVTKYGPLFCLWFDVPQSYGPDHGIPMVRRLRQLQPDLMINNRAYNAVGNRNGVAHHNQVGDFDTPEQRVGGYQDSRPWETCMTICRQWAWKPDDRLKSLDECLRILLNTVGGDGNLLLNVGPDASGKIESRQAERLAEIGAWLERNGGAVFDTRGGPVKPGNGYVTTRKDDTIYVHVFSTAPERILLPAFDRTVLSAAILGGAKVECTTHRDGWTITLPDALREAGATVVALKLDGSAMDLEAVEAPRLFDRATASNTYRKQPAHAPDKAFDGNPETRWATDEGTSEAWIEANLKRPLRVAGVEIHEPESFRRIRKFTLKGKVGGEWRELTRGTDPGKLTFEPVTLDGLRLEIEDASEGPTLTEITLLPAD